MKREKLLIIFITLAGSILISAQEKSPPILVPGPAVDQKPVPGREFSADPAKKSPTAEAATPGKMEVSDARFLSEAIQGGMLEMELATVAQQKAAKPSIRHFAERLHRDHAKSMEELLKLASKKGMTSPKTLSETNRAMAARLSRLSGEEFDQAYLGHLVGHHTASIKQFEDTSKTGNDVEVQSFARTILPTLREHLRLTRELHPGKPVVEGAGAEGPVAPTPPKTSPPGDKVDRPENIDTPNVPDKKTDPAPNQTQTPIAPANGGANEKK